MSLCLINNKQYDGAVGGIQWYYYLKSTCNRAHTYTHKSLQEHIELNNIINNYNAQINAVNINRQGKMGMGRFPRGKSWHNHNSAVTVRDTAVPSYACVQECKWPGCS